MIPRVLHYCWFGAADMPAELLRFQETWRSTNPGFEIRAWSEENFDLSSSAYASQALADRRYAFTSDFVRASVLYRHGGVYLDTDVELKASLEPFMDHAAFLGFEAPGIVTNAVWGSIAGHPLARAVLDYYDGRTLDSSEPPNTDYLTRLLADHFAIDTSRDEAQIGDHGLVALPSTTFCLDLPNNVATHHFSGSWLGERTGIASYKTRVHADWYTNRAAVLADEVGDVDIVVRLARAMGERRFAIACAKVFGLRAPRRLFRRLIGR